MKAVILIALIVLGVNALDSTPFVHPMIAEYNAIANHPSTPAWEAHILRMNALELHERTKDLTHATPQITKWKTIAQFDSAKGNQAHPQAFMFGGGSGAGKSYLEKVFEERTGLKKNQAIWLDPDLLMGGIDCYEQNDPSALCRAGMYNYEGGEAADALLDMAIKGKYHIVLDGTMKGKDKSIAKFNRLNAAKYKVSFLGATQPTFSSVIGASKRAMNVGGGSYSRWVPLAVVVGAHAGFSAAFPDYLAVKWTGTVELYHPYFQGGSEPLLLYANNTIKNEEEYNKFLAKKDDNEAAIRLRMADESDPQTDVLRMYDEVMACANGAAKQHCCSALVAVEKTDTANFVSKIHCGEYTHGTVAATKKPAATPKPGKPAATTKPGATKKPAAATTKPGAKKPAAATKKPAGKPKKE